MGRVRWAVGRWAFHGLGKSSVGWVVWGELGGSVVRGGCRGRAGVSLVGYQLWRAGGVVGLGTGSMGTAGVSCLGAGVGTSSVLK